MDQEKYDSFSMAQVKLKDEFKQLIQLKQGLASEVDILQFLDRKISSAKFDRQIANKLFENVAKNSEDLIQIEDFIKLYSDTESQTKKELLFKVPQYEEYRYEYNNKKYKLIDAQAQEIMNEYQIMVGSAFMMNLGEANFHGSILKQASNYLLEVEYQQQKYRSQNAQPQNNKEITFNEELNLEIDNPNELIKFSIYEITLNGINQLISQGEIDLQDFEDQQKRAHEISLTYENIQIGSMQFSGQWVHSKVKYLSDFLVKWENSLTQLHLEIQDLERQLSEIRKPFSHIWTSIQQTQDDENDIYQETQDMYNQAAINSQLFAQLGRLKVQAQQLTDIPAEKLAFYTFAIYLALTFVSMLYRPDFVNLTFAALIFALQCDKNFISAIKTKTFYYQMLLVALGSMIYDLIFLLMMTNTWNNQVSPLESANEMPIKRVILALCYISFFFRFIIIYVLWLFQKDDQSAQLF